MLHTKGYAVQSAEAKFELLEFERRELTAKDVLIEIMYCGVCHSDIHQARNEWQNSTYPMVPGHEIVGRVKRIGAEVSKFKEGDYAGVGCFVDSCRNCEPCRQDVEQFCLIHNVSTYNGTEMDEKTPTFGGYSSQIVVDEETLKIVTGICRRSLRCCARESRLILRSNALMCEPGKKSAWSVWGASVTWASSSPFRWERR